MYHLLSTIISYLECNSSFGITSLERINDAQARTIQFCASWVSVCSKFVQMNETIINSITYSMCNIHIYDNYFKYFVYYLYFSNVIKHPLLTLNWSLYIYRTKEKHIFINFNLKENQKYLRNLGNFAKIPNHFDDFFFSQTYECLLYMYSVVTLKLMDDTMIIMKINVIYFDLEHPAFNSFFLNILCQASSNLNHFYPF